MTARSRCRRWPITSRARLRHVGSDLSGPRERLRARPADAANAITTAAESGAVGGSIEDWDPGGELYPIDHAVERVDAAARAAAALDFTFTLTARAENFIRGNPDLDDTIARLQVYERAGRRRPLRARPRRR